MLPYTPTAYTQCYFPLDEDLRDESGNGHVLMCSYESPVFGNISGRLGFRAGTRYNQFLYTNDGCGMTLGDSTLMFWVYCVEYPTAGYPYKFADICIGISGLNLNIDYYNNNDLGYKLQFERYVGKSSNTFIYPHNIDVYHHVAVVTHSGSSIEYYCDGALINSSTPVTTTGAISNSIHSVFGNIDTISDMQTLYLSEIVVESQALSGAAVTAIYSQGL